MFGNPMTADHKSINLEYTMEDVMTMSFEDLVKLSPFKYT